MADAFSMFSAAELSAMRLDGELFALHAGVVATDEPDVLSVRVRLARGDAPEHFIVDRLSAAWVWDAVTTPPRSPELCVDMHHRSTKAELGPWMARHVNLKPGELVDTSSGGVISPWRTVLHLLRWPPDLEPRTLSTIVARLVSAEGLSSTEARERFESEQGINVRSRFGQLLKDLLGQEENG